VTEEERKRIEEWERRNPETAKTLRIIAALNEARRARGAKPFLR
jgi:hypothetical protein